MSVIAAVIRELIAAGVEGEALAAAVERIEGAQVPQRTARQERNARYYQARKARASGSVLKASERLKASESGSPEEKIISNLSKEKDPKGSTKKGEPNGAAGHEWPADAFEQFYSAYPRKKAPQDARKAFAAVQRSGSVPFERLMQGVQTLLATRPDKQFTPYPASWLRSGSWDDEPERLTVNGARGPPKETVQSAAIALEEWTRANDRPDRPLLTAVRR